MLYTISSAKHEVLYFLISIKDLILVTLPPHSSGAVGIDRISYLDKKHTINIFKFKCNLRVDMVRSHS